MLKFYDLMNNRYCSFYLLEENKNTNLKKYMHPNGASLVAQRVKCLPAMQET